MDNQKPFPRHGSSPADHHANRHVVHPSRRDFLRVLMGGALAGASLMELAYHRAAWARAAVDSGSKLFDIEKAAEGIYFAQARPQAMINCNAVHLCGGKLVVVVDAHPTPGRHRVADGQIKREIRTARCESH